MWLDVDPHAVHANQAQKAGSWDQILVDSVRPQLQSAWRWLGDDFSAVPLAGVAGAIVIHVARGWGTRRWQERGRAAVAFVEAANRGTADPKPTVETHSTLLEGFGQRLLHLARTLARDDHALLLRVYRQLLTTSAADEAVPRIVLLLRGAVAVGVVVGAVPEPQHRILDSWATTFGLGLAASADRDSLATAAHALLSELPECESRERIEQATLSGISMAPVVSSVGWNPFATPAPRLPESALSKAMVATLAAGGTLPDAARWLAGLGGKHLRGTLVLAAARLVGNPCPNTVQFAADVEWLHTASLLLDDIVDKAEIRRGAPALHRQSSPAFAAGLAAWILAEIAQRQPDLVPAMFTLAEGQRIELALSRNDAPTLQHWYDIAGAKTAALFSAAAAGGARCAGADTQTIRHLARFGHELGLAFQLVDDILDVTGLPEDLGKPAGQDAVTQRPSFVAIFSRETGLANASAIAQCAAKARTHAERALGHLSYLNGDSTELRQIVSRCIERSS